jgi:cytochrome c556
MIHRIALAALAALAGTALAQSHDPAAPGAADSRQHVELPAPMREHTLASMRDHLQALRDINLALAGNDFEKAANVAEQRLGMSSLEEHGAAHLAAFMPKPMQDIGTQMHRAASRFAVEAQNASVSNDVKPALAALGTVMQQCVACHAAYRLH